MDGIDMDDLARGVEILVDDAIRKAAPGIARQAKAEVDSTIAMLQASFELAMSGVLAAVAEGARHEPWAQREHTFGDQVAHLGGTWRCVARRGARATDEPGPESGVWLLTQTGVASVSVTSVNARLARLHIGLSDGTTKAVDIRVPGIKPRGTYSEKEVYQELDTVARDGGSFIAMKNNPGTCPGPDWMALTLRGKPGAVSAAELEKLKHWLENEANARSIKERLEDRLGMVIEAVKSAYPHRERAENEYREFAERLAKALTAVLVEECYGGDVAGRAQQAVECVQLLEHVLMGAFEAGHSQKGKNTTNLDERAARTALHEAWRLNSLVEAVPQLFGSPQRRQAAANWTRGVQGLIQRGHDNDALAPMYEDHVMAFVPKTAEPIFVSASPEGNDAVTRAVCIPFFGLLAHSEPEQELAA
jgi:hypothetical protein